MTAGACSAARSATGAPACANAFSGCAGASPGVRWGAAGFAVPGCVCRGVLRRALLLLLLLRGFAAALLQKKPARFLPLARFGLRIGLDARQLHRGFFCLRGGCRLRCGRDPRTLRGDGGVRRRPPGVSRLPGRGRCLPGERLPCAGGGPPRVGTLPGRGGLNSAPPSGACCLPAGARLPQGACPSAGAGRLLRQCLRRGIPSGACKGVFGQKNRFRRGAFWRRGDAQLRQNGVQLGIRALHGACVTALLLHLL